MDCASKTLGVGDLGVERELDRYGKCIYIIVSNHYADDKSFPTYYARSLCGRVIGGDFPTRDVLPYPDPRNPKRLYCEKCQQSMEHVEYEVEKQFA